MWFSIIAANAGQQVFGVRAKRGANFLTPRSSTWRLRHFGTRACDSMPTGARQSTNQKLCNFNSVFYFVLRNFFHLHAGDKCKFDLNFLYGIWAWGNFFLYFFFLNVSIRTAILAVFLHNIFIYLNEFGTNSTSISNLKLSVVLKAAVPINTVFPNHPSWQYCWPLENELFLQALLLVLYYFTKG